MWHHRPWVQRWIARRVQRKSDRLARRLNLDDAQRADLDAIVTALAEARRAVWLGQRQTAVEIAEILRHTDIKASALQTEISESLDEVKAQVDVLAARLVTLVEHLDDAQRRQLAAMIEQRLHLQAAC